MRAMMLLMCAAAGALHAQSRTTVRPREPMAAGGRPVLARPELGAALFSPSTKDPTIGATDIQIYDTDPKVTLAWRSPFEAPGWRWQVSERPFGDDAALAFPGLLLSGTVAGKSFPVVFATLPAFSNASSGRSGPVTFHVRIVPVNGGQPAGPPSNTVVVRYVPGARPTNVAGEALQAGAEARALKNLTGAVLSAAYQTHSVDIVSFTPAVFPDPSQWGCVVIVTNPFAGQRHPLGAYPPGTHCGAPYTGASYQADSWDDYVGGWLTAYEGLVDVYGQAKAYLAKKIASAVPCNLLPKSAADDCQRAAEQVAGAALSAGMAYAGVPPALPSLDALGSMAKGKIAQGAVDFTCEEVKSQGGICSDVMRSVLKKAYEEGLDQLQAQIKQSASEPGCGNVVEAHHNGREPLPCFSAYPGIVVKPAPGTVYEPPRAVVRVTRQKSDPGLGAAACALHLSMPVTNHFPGGTLSGIAVKPTALSGYPFASVTASAPVLAVGQSALVTMVMSTVNPYVVPGHLVQPLPGWSADWLALYLHGSATVTAGMRTIDPKGNAQMSCTPGSAIKTVTLP
ncbi:MAG: hypothetical protein U0132_08365 [Gemmatimonadaceae bacterium]